MIDVVMTTGRLTPARGRALQETLPALDAKGIRPSNAIAVLYSMYWRVLGGKIYSSSAPIEDNEIEMVIPKVFMNPHTTRIYIDLFWVNSDNTMQKYATYTVDVIDEADTGTTTPVIVSAPYPVMFMSGGLVQAGEPIGALAWRCPAGGGVIQMLAAGATTAAVGDEILIELTEDLNPTAETIALPEGELMVERPASILVAGGSVYRFVANTVGSTYEGENVYAWFMFYPAQ